MKPRPSWFRKLLADRFFLCAIFSVAAILVFFGGFLTYLILEYGLSIEFLAKPLTVGLACAQLFIAFCYGNARTWPYHPTFDEKYREWLATTPWTPKYPLPKGPLRLVWSDLIVIGILTGLACLLASAYSPSIWPFLVGPTVLFAVAVAAVWTFANWTVDQDVHVHAVLWVPVVIAALQLPPEAMLLCPFVMAGIAWHGVRCSLQRFPWSSCEKLITLKKTSTESSSLVGWPFSNLLFEPKEYRTTFRRALMGALLLGAWTWAVLESIETNDPEDDIVGFMGIVAIGCLFIAGVRLSHYGPAICSQLCWGHRLANNQWLIPKHDVVFAAPLLMGLIGTVAPWILHYAFGASVAVACAVPVGIVRLIAKSMGPSVRELNLTGPHSAFGEVCSTNKFSKVSG